MLRSTLVGLVFVVFVTFVGRASVYGDEGENDLPQSRLRVYRGIIHSDGKDNTMLLSYLEQRICAEEAPSIEVLIAQLGDDDFNKREAASRYLVAVGDKAIPRLQDALKSTDIEVSQRAMVCLQRIEVQEKEFYGFKPIDVIETILQRNPKGIVRAMLNYIEVANSECLETIYFGLDAVLEKEKEFDVGLLPMLESTSDKRRELVGFLVGKFGNETHRKAARALLQDKNSKVRLRTAQGLLAGKDTSGIPTLISLLEKTTYEVAVQAEELLRYVAGESAPTEVVKTGDQEELSRCKVAWEQWWKTAKTKIDLEKVVKSARLPRLLLVVEPNEWELIPSFHNQHDLRMMTARNEIETLGACWLVGCQGSPRTVPFGFEPILEWKVDDHICSPKKNRKLICKAMGDTNKKLGQLPTITHLYYHRIRFNYDRSIELISKPWLGFRRIVESDVDERVIWETVIEIPTYRIDVVWPLVRVGFHAPKSFVSQKSDTEWLQQLKSPDSLQRRIAFDWIGQAENTEPVFRALVDGLNSEDERIRLHALVLLYWRRDTRVDLSFKRMSDESATYLEKGPRASDALAKIIQCVYDSNEAIVDEAMDLLVGCGQKAIPSVLEYYKKEKDPSKKEVRLRFLRVLVKLDSVRTQESAELNAILRDAFHDTDPIIRECVVRWMLVKVLYRPIIRSTVKQYVPELVLALTDSDRSVSITANSFFHVLEELGEPGVPFYLQKLKCPECGARAARILQKIHNNNPQVVPRLIDALAYTDLSDMKEDIITALGACTNESQKSRILEALRKELVNPKLVNNTPEVLEATIKSLGLLGQTAKSCIPELLLFVESGNAEIAEAALKAVEQIDPTLAEKIRQDFENKMSERK